MGFIRRWKNARRHSSAGEARPQKVTLGGQDSSDVPDLGPLVPLFDFIHEGRMPLQHAFQRAARLGAEGAVTPTQLQALAEAARRQADAGSWRQALSFALLVYAASDAAWTGRHDRASGLALVKAGADLVSVTHVGLFEIGHISLWAQAMSAAQRVISVAEELGLDDDRGIVLQRRGSLVLDCYTAGRSAAAYRNEFQNWVEKAMFAADPGLHEIAGLVAGTGVVDGVAAGKVRWPDFLEAMDLAEADLRAALLLVRPERRGRVLKALTQVLEWRVIFGGPSLPTELASLCEQALKALESDDISARLAVRETLRRAQTQHAAILSAGHPDVDRLVNELENDWSGFLRRMTEWQAWELVGQAASDFSERDPERALRLLALQRLLPDMWAQEARRTRHLDMILQLHATAQAPSWVRDIWESVESYDTVASKVFALADRTAKPDERRLTDDQTMAALTLVMMASTKFDRERVGLQAVPLLKQSHSPEWDQYVYPLRGIIASLHQAEAVNLERQGQPDAAIGMFLEAASRYLVLASPDSLVTTLHYIADLVEDGGVGTLPALSAWCVVNGLRVELLAPDSGPAALQRLVAATLASQAKAGATFGMIQQLFQAAKGRRFAAIFAHGVEGWSLDNETRRLLADEEAAEARLPGDRSLLQPPNWEAVLDDDELVTAFVSDFELVPSDTPEGEMVNQQRAIERRIMARLTPPDVTDLIPPSLREIQAVLDPQTALLQLYEGRWTDGKLATYSLLLTDEHQFLSIRTDELPAGMICQAAEGREVYLPAGGFYVAAVRRAVQEPASGNVSRLGEELLHGAADRYASPVLEHQDELRAAGKDRLLVVPHAGLHFLPLHLAGPPGSPLADQWTVTYLLNLAQLTSRRTAVQAPALRRDAAVFALGYQDQPRLPALNCSVAEAQAIANIVGVTPMLDPAATESAFAHALQTCRFVHLRAHGKHNVDAPLFQTVFLAPGAGHDGRLRAHEVLPLDLHGLELVTLGACETALGRTDISDNLRGIPAALLLAGAQAVVGTLWPVDAEASTTFFTELYRSLTVDAADLIEAFAVAQHATRALHPEYRDWGAFNLTGGLPTRRDRT